jgi:cell filamentation protein
LKGGNSFCYPEHISAQMDALFHPFQRADVFAGLAQDAFLDRLTPFLGELNAIHPFREGNGRTQLSFIGLLGEHSGHPFHLEELSRETYLPAVIDSYFGKLPRLRDELRKLLT